MKVRSSVKRICTKCKVVRRQGVIRIICDESEAQAASGVETMARIAGVDLPLNKRVEIGLTYIYGIGRPHGQLILEQADVDRTRASRTSPRTRSSGSARSSPTRARSRAICARTVGLDIKRLMEINCYRGMRHRRGLPVRGQRTHTNARTRKGPRKGAIAGKKKATKK